MALILSTKDGNQITGLQARALHQSTTPMRDMVVNGVGQNFQTPTPSGFVATVGAGLAIVDGVIVENTASLQVQMPQPTKSGQGALVLTVSLALGTVTLNMKDVTTLSNNNLVSTPTGVRDMTLYTFNYSTSGITNWTDARPLLEDGGSPAGMMQMFAGDNAPLGYLICDGSAVPITKYPNLYKYIGKKYGGTADTFNLPDMRGRVVVGVDSRDIDINSVGRVGGEKLHTLTQDELPTHRIYTNAMDGSYYGNAISSGALLQGGSTYGVALPLLGRNYGHNNMQPYIAMNYIIKI